MKSMHTPNFAAIAQVSDADKWPLGVIEGFYCRSVDSNTAHILCVCVVYNSCMGTVVMGYRHIQYCIKNNTKLISFVLSLCRQSKILGLFLQAKWS